ncbi:MAG: hypothetical protein E6R03_17725 [Hyphomicrobiaceae bacterium]|nr:MAG: hypothetical protein E6R03_17725 [Hyphomicrobiaceae bacterium]
MRTRDNVETLFIASMLHIGGFQTVETATEHQDKYKHWDVRINGVTYDVKAAKRINRSDEVVQYEATWVELRNVRGLGGWLVGEAEKIAFELEHEFLICDRMGLFELITARIKPVVGKGLYERYQRDDRADLMTLVPIADIIQDVDSYTIPKFKINE